MASWQVELVFEYGQLNINFVKTNILNINNKLEERIIEKIMIFQVSYYDLSCDFSDFRFILGSVKTNYKNIWDEFLKNENELFLTCF